MILGWIKPPDLSDSRNISQELHLVNCDGIQLHKPFVMQKILVDKQGIQVFKIRKTHKLRDAGINPDISGLVGVCLPPLFYRDTE